MLTGQEKGILKFIPRFFAVWPVKRYICENLRGPILRNRGLVRHIGGIIPTGGIIPDTSEGRS